MNSQTVNERRIWTRRQFLQMAGTGMASVALLSAVGCKENGSEGGGAEGNKLAFTSYGDF